MLTRGFLPGPQRAALMVIETLSLFLLRISVAGKSGKENGDLLSPGMVTVLFLLSLCR